MNLDFNMTEGNQYRDYVHVDDIVKVLIKSVDSNIKNDVFNICSGTGIRLRDIAEYMKTKLKSKSNINFGAIPYRKNEIFHMVGDNTKAKLHFDFKPDLKLTDF